MAQKSKIEWTENTWNPVTGCTKISSGCKNCYAYRMTKRLESMNQRKYYNGFEVTLHEDCLQEPYEWKKGKVIFVNSMSDLFHKNVPLDFIEKIFKVMNETPQHTYQILTKRAARMNQLSHNFKWTPNIWMGVSVEDSNQKNRIDYLKDIPAEVKFISFEPLIDDVGKLNLKNIDWAIIGGESGPGARPVKEDWILNIKKHCNEQNVMFYFKQWGGTNKKKAGRKLLGKTWDAMPQLL